MATFTKILSNANYRLELTVTQESRNIANNTSNVKWNLGIRKLAGTGYHTDNSSSWAINIDGIPDSGSVSPYNFENYSFLTVAAWTYTIPHNADGSKTINVSGTFNDGGVIGSATVSGSLQLVAIERASKPTTNKSNYEFGETIAINTNRASSSFTHDVYFDFTVGNFGNPVLTGIADSANFSIPMEWMNRIPAQIKENARILLRTKSGGTTIGDEIIWISFSVPDSIRPSFNTITHNEYIENVKTKVGVYVQSKTRLNLALTGASGTYGSSITSYSISVDGQTINASSGTTGYISRSGNLTVTGTITDSRNRSASKTITISVLPYQAPRITSVKFERCTASGDLDPLGVYVKVSFSGNVTSLKINNVEKNSLTYRIFSKKQSESSYISKSNVPYNALSYNGNVILNEYPIDYSYNFVARIVDIFGETSSMGLIPIGEVLMHWQKNSAAFGMLLPGSDANVYVGNKGIRSLGPIYQNNDKKVVSSFASDKNSLDVITEESFLGSINATTGSVPASYGWYWVVNVMHRGGIGDGSNYGEQIVFKQNSSIPYTRSRNNGTWGTWTTLMTRDLVYPVGSIYTSVRNVNPGSYLGGTWERFSSGRMLVGVNESDSDFSAVLKYGGAKTHTLTANEMPSHTHTFNKSWNNPNGPNSFPAAGWDRGTSYLGVDAKTNATGGNAAHNNMPPYIAVYMWRRTA